MVNKAINNPWSSDSLFAKSLTYLEQMEASIADQWQFGLWSSLSLELLARAALSNISPVLLADSKNWRNITFALGNAPTAKKFNAISISTKEVLARLTELLPEFTEEMAGFCSKHTDDRNAELHSGGGYFWSKRYVALAAPFLPVLRYFVKIHGEILGGFCF